MTKRPYLFHTIAAVAFLTATPMFAMNSIQIFLPSMQFVEDSAQPTRAATTLIAPPKAQK